MQLATRATVDYCGMTVTGWSYRVFSWNGKTDQGLTPEWALIELPDPGLNPETLNHSADGVVQPASSPAFCQGHYANLDGRSDSLPPSASHTGLGAE